MYKKLKVPVLSNACDADLNPGRDVDGVGCGPGRGERSPA